MVFNFKIQGKEGRKRYSNVQVGIIESGSTSRRRRRRRTLFIIVTVGIPVPPLVFLLFVTNTKISPGLLSSYFLVLTGKGFCEHQDNMMAFIFFTGCRFSLLADIFFVSQGFGI
jgi:hypothetical protein